MVELLVVIGIIVLIVAFLFPVFGRVRANARMTACMANQRQIAASFSAYGTDNNARLPSPRTDDGAVDPNGRNPWVRATGAGLVGGVETLKSLENGVLWEYMDKNPKAYVSPLDPTGRVRSYSLNAYVGTQTCPDDFGCGSIVPSLPGGLPFGASTISKIPQPAKTLCSIPEEAVQGYNQQGFLVNWQTPEWIDIPAFWDTFRVSVSFVDGSTDQLNIFGPQFILDAQAAGNYFLEPGEGSIWLRMRQHLLPGRLPF